MVCIFTHPFSGTYMCLHICMYTIFMFSCLRDLSLKMELILYITMKLQLFHLTASLRGYIISTFSISYLWQNIP